MHSLRMTRAAFEVRRPREGLCCRSKQRRMKPKRLRPKARQAVPLPEVRALFLLFAL
jgi:hypothetical protein